MKTLINTFAILVAGLAMSGVSYANTITLTAQTVPNTSPTFTDVLQFITFNASLGTLTNVEIDSAANFVANLTVTDPSSNSANGAVASYSNAKATGSVDVLGPGGMDVLLKSATPLQSDSVNLGNANTYTGLTAGTSNIFNPTDLVDFTGNGTTTVALSFKANNFSASGLGTGGLQYSANGVAGGSVDIIYTYTPNSSPATPEPGTWLLMSTAVVGLFVARKRFSF